MSPVQREVSRNKVTRLSREALRRIAGALEVIERFGDDSVDGRSMYRLLNAQTALTCLLEDEAGVAR
jgi:hypothetical protein